MIPSALINFLISFGVNLVVAIIIMRSFYYPKSRRLDFCFTFILMSISIFTLIYVLNDSSMKTGFALGLFAIFSIIRYRTESMPVREMTYLFVIIALSVVNAMSRDIPWLMIGAADVFLIASIGLSELFRGKYQDNTKLIQYDRIDLIKVKKRDELIADLKERTGLDIIDVEVGHIDFLKDSAMLKVHYNLPDGKINSADKVVKFPKTNDNGDED